MFHFILDVILDSYSFEFENDKLKNFLGIVKPLQAAT